MAELSSASNEMYEKEADAPASPGPNDFASVAPRVLVAGRGPLALSTARAQRFSMDGRSKMLTSSSSTSGVADGA